MSRSVEAVVADMVEKGEAALIVADEGGNRLDLPAAVAAMGVPALVEALADIAETDLSGIADKPSVGDELDETLVGIVRGYQSMARAALGGEQVQGRAELLDRIAELEADREEMLLALRGFAFAELDDHGEGEFAESYADDLYERRFLHAESTPSGETWIHRTPSLDEFVIETLDRVLSRRSSSPTPTTPKGAEQ